MVITILLIDCLFLNARLKETCAGEQRHYCASLFFISLSNLFQFTRDAEYHLLRTDDRAR